MTLKELAREMRKLFEFDYVTVDANESITFWVRKPLYISMCGCTSACAAYGSVTHISIPGTYSM